MILEDRIGRNFIYLYLFPLDFMRSRKFNKKIEDTKITRIYRNISRIRVATWKDIKAKYRVRRNIGTASKLISTWRFPAVGANISIIVNLSSVPSRAEPGINHKTEEAITWQGQVASSPRFPPKLEC